MDWKPLNVFLQHVRYDLNYYSKHKLQSSSFAIWLTLSNAILKSVYICTWAPLSVLLGQCIYWGKLWECANWETVHMLYVDMQMQISMWKVYSSLHCSRLIISVGIDNELQQFSFINDRNVFGLSEILHSTSNGHCTSRSELLTIWVQLSLQGTRTVCRVLKFVPFLSLIFIRVWVN